MDLESSYVCILRSEFVDKSCRTRKKDGYFRNDAVLFCE